MPRIILDTDFASLSYQGRLPAPLAAWLAGNEIGVTFVTVGELARWAEKRHRGTRARVLIEQFGHGRIGLGHSVIGLCPARQQSPARRLTLANCQRRDHARCYSGTIKLVPAANA